MCETVPVMSVAECSEPSAEGHSACVEEERVMVSSGHVSVQGLMSVLSS